MNIKLKGLDMWYFTIINKVTGEERNMVTKFKNVKEAIAFSVKNKAEQKDWKMLCKSKY